MDYFIADPAGNITAFVLGSPDDGAANKLLSASSLKIEQVAFLSTPQQGGHGYLRAVGMHRRVQRHHRAGDRISRLDAFPLP